MKFKFNDIANIKEIPKVNLLNLNLEKMRDFLKYIQEKPFRANQIMKWIYHHFCDDFSKMSNISKKLKNKLIKYSFINPPKFIQEKKSFDGTIKWSFLTNKKHVETVYIPEKNRATVCISSQIGCLLNCDFCYTGKMGFQKNLKVFEIIGQLWNVIKLFNEKNKIKKITNIVFMGMGEPLLNFKNIVMALNIILHDHGFNFSKHKVTLSTAGIVPLINKLNGLIDIKLAISLHASNNKIRNRLMPINKKYNIQSVLESANNYLKNSKANKGKITIEYVMLDKVNDSLKNAEELAVILKNIPSKVNLIPWNSFPESVYNTSTASNIVHFSKILTKRKIFNTIRKNRGKDIYAACGQLNNNFKI
ncbi:23S rRNA (adenine(2503)-C(2))-methyltransferase RlmN [Buchnera aphidicola]|uniref:23S rRNA (adenine(2503)-C(2))-methyltransferase RlmN n=1 Tax=Buchnera aphidicola TaxID=9 RepID=UPI0034644A78